MFCAFLSCCVCFRFLAITIIPFSEIGSNGYIMCTVANQCRATASTLHARRNCSSVRMLFDCPSETVQTIYCAITFRYTVRTWSSAFVVPDLFTPKIVLIVTTTKKKKRKETIYMYIYIHTKHTYIIYIHIYI